ncbi:hypothetical protein R3P38DRAFT_2987220 [Favolaschia claudopus]|uniref:Uncharacterized protein n=1 Tax=Favolaschia claudopus TaxID=2862362 RepID=A0AAW0AXW7_9AGAR
MDPLKVSDLTATQDWIAFTPDTKGYLSPQELELWRECDGIESQLQRFTAEKFIYDNDARISVSPSRGQTCIVPRLDSLSGALAPLRDAFCLWRYKLSSGANAPPLMLFSLSKGHPTRAREFQGYDAELLCHLAPLAKAYGFQLYITQLHYYQSQEEQFCHPESEHLDDFDPDSPELNSKLSSRPKVFWEWDEILGLDGRKCDPQVPGDFWETAFALVERNPLLYRELMDLSYEEEHELVSDVSYWATVEYTQFRRGSYLLLIP